MALGYNESLLSHSVKSPFDTSYVKRAFFILQLIKLYAFLGRVLILRMVIKMSQIAVEQGK